MKIKNIVIVVFTVLVLTGFAKNLFAQQISETSEASSETSSKKSAQKSDSDFHKWEVYGGYSYLLFSPGSTGYHGFEASATGNFTRYLGAKFDVSASAARERIGFRTDTAKQRLYNFLGGIQLKDNSREKRMKPFVHALAGVAHYKQSNCQAGSCVSVGNVSYLSMVIGGGIDVKAGKRVDVRLFQVDYNPSTRVGSTGRLWFKNFRIGAGIVFH